MSFLKTQTDGQVISQDLCFIQSHCQKSMHTKRQTHPKSSKKINWSFIFSLLLFSFSKWTGKMIYLCKSTGYGSGILQRAEVEINKRGRYKIKRTLSFVDCIGNKKS